MDKKAYYTEKLTQLLIQKGATRSEAEWLIAEGSNFSDDDLGTMIAPGAVAPFRLMIEKINTL